MDTPRSRHLEPHETSQGTRSFAPWLPMWLALACALIVAVGCLTHASPAFADDFASDELHAGNTLTTAGVPQNLQPARAAQPALAALTPQGIPNVVYLSLKDCKIKVDDLKYTGKWQTPRVSVKLQAGKTIRQNLVEGYHYTVVYKDAKGKVVSKVKKPGTYRAIIKSSIYEGRVVKTFKVARTDYRYKVKFTSRPYSGVATQAFVQTKNPDASTFTLEFLKGKKPVKAKQTGVEKVKGGYLVSLTIAKPGTLKVRAVEHILRQTSTTIAAGKVKVRSAALAK